MNWIIFTLTSALILSIALYENLGWYSIWFYIAIVMVLVVTIFSIRIMESFYQSEWEKTCKNVANFLLDLEKRYEIKL